MEEADFRTVRSHDPSTAEETRALTAQLQDKVVVVTGGEAVVSVRRLLRRLQDMRRT